MKRWLFILTMLLVGIAIFGSLVWAAAYHNVRGHSPSTTDNIIAAAAFWTATVLPIIAGLILASRGVNAGLKPAWPVVEILFLGSLLLVVFGSDVASDLYSKLLPSSKISERLLPILVTVAIGTSTLDLRLGIRHRKWMMAILSTLAVIGGTIILLVFNAWAIYWE